MKSPLIFFLLFTLLTACQSATPQITPDAACSLAKLTPSATWLAATGSLTGQITLTNYTNTNCTWSGSPQVIVLDESGNFLAVQSISDSDLLSTYTLSPQDSLAIEFRWNNWCNNPPQGTISLRLRFSGSSTALDIPVLDPNGQPLSDTPRCEDAAQPSLFSMDAPRTLNH